MTTHSGRSVVIAFALWGVIVRTTRIEKKKGCRFGFVREVGWLRCCAHDPTQEGTKAEA